MKNTRVKRQLNFVYYTAILIPILIIGTFLISYTYSLLTKHYQNQVDADNVRVKSILFDATLNMYVISDDIFSDRELQSVLSERYSDKKASDRACNKYTKLTNSIKKNAFISSIELYVTNPTIHEYGSFKPVTSEVENTAWYSAAMKQSDILWKSIQRIDFWKHPTQELCLIRRVPVFSTNEYAVLVIRLSNNYLKNRVQTSSMSQIAAVNSDPIFYSSRRDLEGSSNTIPIDYKQYPRQYSGEITFEGKKGIASMSTLLPYASKNQIHIYSIDFDAPGDIRNIMGYCLAIILISALLPLISIHFFTSKFSTRVETLRGEMHKASSGDYHIIDSFKGNDEISEAFSDLQIMIQSIKKMDSEMYESRIKEQVLKNQQQKMEFKMLCSQINPHFLYNTLETIRMKAFTAGNTEVAKAIQLLGKSMHYVLENTGTSSTMLKKELDYIETYLAIQKLRFNDRVNYTLTVAENMNLEEYQILPLLLQPIVENSILHGLEETETGGRLSIEVMTKDNEYLLIHIFDNGQGMTVSELEQLTKDIQLGKKSGASRIGLHNINQRIKLYYGEAYGIEIKSQKNEGTLITLMLPRNNMLED